jgi:serine/threonine kinase 32
LYVIPPPFGPSGLPLTYSCPFFVCKVHIDRMGGFEEAAVRFYVAEIALALNYLHSIRIVHRDLKPDNLLLDENGHIHLTDFNIAVHFSTSPTARLLTGVAGSMAYMAPEVLAKRGYSCQIDWWSLGVVVYELIFGRRPFRGKTNSSLTESIQGEKLAWPEDAREKCSPEGMDMIRRVSPCCLVRGLRKPCGWRRGGGKRCEDDARPHSCLRLLIFVLSCFPLFSC